MSLTLVRSAAGFALLAAVAAGCGTAVSAHSTAAKPAATAHHQHVAKHPAASTPASAPASTPVTTPASTPASAHATAPAPSANPIQQGNGGDSDPDNNGGPSDGDGNI